MPIINRQKLELGGIEPTYTVATQTGDMFKWMPGVFLHVKNDDTSNDHDIIIKEQHGTPPPGFEAVDETITIPSESDKLIGPIDKAAFVNLAGYVELTYSAAISDLKIAVFELPK